MQIRLRLITVSRSDQVQGALSQRPVRPALSSASMIVEYSRHDDPLALYPF